MFDWLITAFSQGINSSISLIKFIAPSSMPSFMIHGLGYALFTFFTLKIITFIWSLNVPNR